MFRAGLTRRDGAWWLFAILFFAAGHLFVTWDVWGDPLARLPGPTGDNYMMMWNLGWVKYALDHGSPGFWCSSAYYPDGFLFIYGSHTWLDGVLYWLMSWLLPTGYQGAVLWANITMLMATVGTGLLIISSLRAWGVRHWPILLLTASGAAFSWFRMFALMGHYNFFGTQWMLSALCLLSWSREAFQRGDERLWKRLSMGAGIALGISFLNDQTMAIFAGVLGGLILLSLPAAKSGGRTRGIVAAGLRFYGFAILPASIHLIPVVFAAATGRLDYYHVDKSLPRLVDASSFLLPIDYHFLGTYLEEFREQTGLSWSEGAYLGVVPIMLLLICSVGAFQYIVKKTPEYKICFYATMAAWGFIILGLGDRLMIGHEQFMVMPGRLLKEIPLLNNMRVPQRWVWPAQLCIALAGGALLAVFVNRSRQRLMIWAPLMLALIPPLEGRSYPAPAPVDFRNDRVMRPPGLVESVQRHYHSGGVLTMPVEVTYAHANILQFLWGYDIPMTVVYSARMPFAVHELPWKWNTWTPEAGGWLREKKVSIIVFSYHGDNLKEFESWIREAKEAVPGLIVLNRNGEEF